MKSTRWTLVKVALIAVFTIGLVLQPMDSVADAQACGAGIATGVGFVAMFQLAVWFFYDVITLKRGGWAAPKFGASPWAKQTGPALHLEVVGIALMTMGVAKILAALDQGIPSLVLGGWLVAIGLFLRLWETALHKLFRRRFAVPGSRSDSTAPPSNSGQQGSWAPPGRS